VLTILDNNVAGKIQLSSAEYSAPAPGVATITFTRTGGTASGASVDYATLDGTGANGATAAGGDYTSVASTVTFLAGETSKTVTIPIFDTGVPNKFLTLQISNPSYGVTLGTNTSAQVWIVE
jgi:hypothetical protein